MKRMFLLFSHNITEDQKKDAQDQFGIDAFISLPAELQNLWSNIDPHAETLKNHLRHVMDFVMQNGTQEDIFLVQGESGAVHIMVGFIRSLGFRSCYSTTTRFHHEETLPDGSIENKHVFRHLMFREYEYNQGGI